MKLWTDSHTCKEGGHVFSLDIASSMQKGNVLKQEQVTQGLISYRGRSEYEIAQVSLIRVRSSFDKV